MLKSRLPTPGVSRSLILIRESLRCNSRVRGKPSLQAELRPGPGPATLTASPEKPINLSDQALQHLKKLREESGDHDLLLRVGVKSGGCSGLSYTMDFEEQAAIGKEDTIIAFEGFQIVTDAMSLLYLFGMTLDYSNKLIGGGFIFQNPNAQSSCGCGKSFGV